MSSVDDCSLTTSQQHDNRGEISHSPVEIKLSARIAALYFCPVYRNFMHTFQLSLSSSLVGFSLIFFSPSSLIRGENLPTGSLSFLPSRWLVSSHLPQQFCQVYPEGVLQLAAGNDNEPRRKFYCPFKTFIFRLTGNVSGNSDSHSCSSFFFYFWNYLYQK